MFMLRMKRVWPTHPIICAWTVTQAVCVTLARQLGTHFRQRNGKRALEINPQQRTLSFGCSDAGTRRWLHREERQCARGPTFCLLYAGARGVLRIDGKMLYPCAFGCGALVVILAKIDQLMIDSRNVFQVRTRMDQMYEDKLEGKISEEFWQRKQSEYREQERLLEAQLSSIQKTVAQDNILTVERVFELANKAHSLYLTRNSAERGQLLRSVLLNCATDGASLTPTYRKPFDLIFQRAKTDDWSGRADLNCRPLAPQASALPG